MVQCNTSPGCDAASDRTISPAAPGAPMKKGPQAGPSWLELDESAALALAIAVIVALAFAAPAARGGRDGTGACTGSRDHTCATR